VQVVADGMYAGLWSLCAGPLVAVPKVLYYFPQGRIEQVSANRTSPLSLHPSRLLFLRRGVGILSSSRFGQFQLYPLLQHFLCLAANFFPLLLLLLCFLAFSLYFIGFHTRKRAVTSRAIVPLIRFD
jgi:hypothetical protein